jgi:tRNA U34 5-carboxymethylaminomethyl modifying GTPase MnmE/TrmE
VLEGLFDYTAFLFERDVVEVRMDLEGYPCIVSDTAGLRFDSQDPIEIEGMNRARYGNLV